MIICVVPKSQGHILAPAVPYLRTLPILLLEMLELLVRLGLEPAKYSIQATVLPPDRNSSGRVGSPAFHNRLFFYPNFVRVS